MFIIALLLTQAQPTTPIPVDCSYNPSVLALGVDAFDQDMNGGWRTLAERLGCEGQAAALIEKYRMKQQSMLRVLNWHEGQLRAQAGQYSEACERIGNSRLEGKDVIGWNAYVDAALAFLRNDRPALLQAREKLASWPHASAEDWLDDKGKPISQTNWPPNLDVVDGLIKCFGRPYKEAYDDSCR